MDYRIVATRDGVEYGHRLLALRTRPTLGETVVTSERADGGRPVEWRIVEVLHGPGERDATLRVERVRGEAPEWARDVRYLVAQARATQGERRGFAQFRDTVDGIQVRLLHDEIERPFPTMEAALAEIGGMADLDPDLIDEGRVRFVRRHDGWHPEQPH